MEKQLEEPWQLFRFRSLDKWFWPSFENSQFYCNLIQNLNDPFDCRVRWEDSIRRARASVTTSDNDRCERLNTMLSTFAERDPHLEAGICCFSVNMDNALMWSHYADSHRGVCLMYEFPADYFRKKYEPPGSDGFYFVGGSRVFYGDDVFCDWLKTGNHHEPVEDSPEENAVSRIFCSKAKAWEHEEEWRMVTSKPGLLQFESTHLRQVAFGLRTSASDKERLADMAKRNNPDIVITQAMKSRSSDFKIEYIDA